MSLGMAAGPPRTHAILKFRAAGRTRLVVFDTQDLTLGRATENDVALEDLEMSRRHAVFRRSREGCVVEDMGTSNGTLVNGAPVARAALRHGDVVKIGEVEITYAETTRAPSSLGAAVEYASQIKAFGTPMAAMRGDGESTILGLAGTPANDDEDDFEVRPAGEFDFDLHEASSGKTAPRDLDVEIASLDSDADLVIEESRRPPRPARAPSSDVWELDDPGAQPASSPLALTLEIAGLSGELRRSIEALFGKVVELPSLRVKIKGRDLG